MAALFEELDYCPTPIGALSLRRRFEPALGVHVTEIKLGAHYLMSSAFIASEVALARLGLDRARGAALDVVVGGLGLGHTAQTALAHPRLASLCVVELLAPVIAWHREGLLPMGRAVADDARCRLILGDFFALAASQAGFDPDAPGRRFDAVLLDIDHAPGALLDPANAAFYRADGLRALARHLKPGGVFGLWSNEPPEAAFLATLAEAFDDAAAEPVTFPNPLQRRDVTQTVYLGRARGA
ncbi:MAG: spermidine synthase [Rhodobacterales bacterium CG18_big_fil_WC_8_21_14_2_50_71_9]|nr:MAG: spermidine synthase [Rhodobacterales bacterium CG18_big_fil_WC_8_21_14_2_50_71_9]PJA60707.1 MAG: spermidine synthase [Rhodobacterales bacterium CG_4_9_14_3_um_filter_71_31]